MKNRLKFLIIILFLLPHVVSAQYLRTGYFVENSKNSHLMNPAFAPKRGYISIPVLGSLTVWSDSELGMKNIVFPLDNGKTGYFLHPDVSPERFLSPLKDMNTLYAGVDVDVLSAGWLTKRNSFWTFSIGLRTNVLVNVPKDFFTFLKLGKDSNHTSYLIKDLSVNADFDYVASLGYSLDINDNLRVGAKVRAILPVLGADIMIHSLKLDLADDKWSVATDATSHLYGKNFEYNNNGDNEIRGVTFGQPDPTAISGFGGSVDLGAEWKFLDDSRLNGLSLSASILNLGMVSFGNDHSKMATSRGTAVFEGFDNLFGEDFDFKEQFDEFADHALEMISLVEQDMDKPVVYSTPFSINLGAKYSILDDLMEFGVLYTETPLIGRVGRELTLSYILNPIKDKISIAIGYSLMNIRSSIGWALYFTPDKVINFWVGADYMHLKYSKQYLPIDKLFANVQMGLSVPVGRRSHNCNR